MTDTTVVLPATKSDAEAHKPRSKAASVAKTTAALPGRLRPPKRLNPHQLDVFHAIVSTGSMTGAARLLNISQPGASRSLAELEREIGFALFARDRKRLFITPEGSEFFDEVTRSHLGLDRLARIASEIRELRRGRLRIVAMPALCFGMIPSAIKDFLQQHPSLTISFEAQLSREVIERVANQHVDIGIAQVPCDYPNVKIHSSFRSDCVCVMPADHVLRNKAAIEPADLRDQSFIAMQPQTFAGRQLGQALADAKVRLAPRIDAMASFAVCAMVAEGLGIAVTDPFTAAFAGHRLCQKAFVPTINFGFRLIYPARRVMSQAALALLDHLSAAIERHPLVRGR
jgi:DNA-binding transcriptional LysR family regulator